MTKPVKEREGLRVARRATYDAVKVKISANKVNDIVISLFSSVSGKK